jgi:hypothetical protein
MNHFVRRIVQGGGRVSFAGRMYRGGGLVRGLRGHEVIVAPVNGTKAAVQLFHTRTFCAIAFAFNRELVRKGPAGTRDLLRKLWNERQTKAVVS